MTITPSFETPRHILCVLGTWSKFDSVKEIVEKVGGGFELDIECSELEPDERMQMAFEACMDRVTPTMTDEDWTAIEEHSAVAYVLSPYMTADSAKMISGKLLMILSALLENGGVAAKSESAGIAHGLAKWRQLIAAYEAEQAEEAKSRILYEAWVRRPIKEGDLLYSVGMHLLGKPDIQVNDCVELKAVKLIDSIALRILSSDRLSFYDDVGGECTVQLLPCERYTSEDPNHNPYGYVHLEKAAIELPVEVRLQHHQNFSVIRISKFNELFGGSPVKVFFHNELTSGTDGPFIDVLVYEAEDDEEKPVYMLVTNGMSDAPLTDPRAPGAQSRIELIQYFSSYEDGHAKHLQQLAWLPHFDGFLLQPFDTIAWPQPPVEASPWNNALFLPSPLSDHAEFEWELDSEPCSFLWHVPISDDELNFKRERDIDALLDLMDQTNLPWIFDEQERKSMLTTIS